MLEEINIKMYQNELKNSDYPAIQKKLITKFTELSKEIDKLYNNQEDRYYFDGFLSNLSYLQDWNIPNCQSDYEKLKRAVELYNIYLTKFKVYQDLNQSLKEKSYPKLFKEYEEKLINLFKEMLTYKKKEFDPNLSFLELLDKINIHYNIYRYDIAMIKDAYTNHYVDDNYYTLYPDYYSDIKTYHLNDVEQLLILDDFYKTLTDPLDNYKNNANCYIDINLAPNETISDLYNQEMAKLINLFKEMLNYVKADYDKSNTRFRYYMTQISTSYPFYLQDLINLSSTLTDPHNNYITCIDSLYHMRNNLSHYKEDLKDYNDKKNSGLDEEEFLFEDFPDVE